MLTVLRLCIPLLFAVLLAAPVHAAEPAVEVETQTADGRTVKAMLAVPGDFPTAAVMVLHDWYGLTPDAIKTAERLAAKGYVALAVDLYDGQLPKNPKQAKTIMLGMDKAEATETVKAWAEWLRAHPMGNGKVGSVGFSLGGGWSLRAGMAAPMDATVIYYGYVKQKADELKTLTGPLLGHFAKKDKRVNKKMVGAFEKELDKVGKEGWMRWYDAHHGFAKEGSRRYDDKAAKLAWRRTMSFLGVHLLGDEKEGDCGCEAE